MIDSSGSNISFVLQGPPVEETSILIQQIQKALPAAEIIASTWKGSEDYAWGNVDKEIYLDDPGGFKNENGEYLNVNRQIKSSRDGVLASSRSYVCKIRTDISLDFLKLVKVYNQYCDLSNSEFFGQRVLVLNLTTINPKRLKRLFAINDWIYLGKKEDVLKIVDAPDYPKEYVNYEKRWDTLLRYNAEQWFMINMIFGSELNHRFPHTACYTDELLALHKSLIRELIIIGPFKINLKSTKYNLFRFDYKNMYTFKEWKKELFEVNVLNDPERWVYTLVANPIIRNWLKKLNKVVRS